MSEWQYTPIENIAYALIDIANTLERIEKKMPTPQGNITGYGIWQGQPEENQPVEETKDEPGVQEVSTDPVQED